MATNTDDQALRHRLQDEPSVKPSDTHAVLQNDRQETQQVRQRVRGLEGVAPEDTLDELRDEEQETQQTRAEREERADEEERRREARRQAEAAQQAERPPQKTVESYGTDAPAVDLRRLEHLTTMASSQAAEARAWSAEDATKRASADLQALQSAENADERFRALYDIALGSRQNRHYREAMQQVDPGAAKVAKEQEKNSFHVSGAEFRALRDAGQPATAHPPSVAALERRYGSEVAANDPQPPRGDAANDPRRGQPMTLEASDLQRLAETRARDKEEAEHAIGVRPAPPASANKAEEQAAQAAVDRGLQAQLDEDQRRRGRREQEQAGVNTVDVNRTGKELERGEFIMPRRIAQAYTEVDGKFFAKDSNRVMFEDRGNKLATSTTDKAAIADMVALAKAKQWESLKLTGSQEFRREAWLQAESQGIRTQGYTPKQADLAALESMRQERSTNSITPLQERKPAQREHQADQPLARAPRHDLNKNQAAIHDTAMKALTSNLAELHKRPALRERSEEDMQKLAFWRGVVAESNKLQPEAMQKEALARFDKQAEDPQFVLRLRQETEPKVQDKTSERVQARETHEQSL